MRWLLRFLAWATALALPFWLLADSYHHALGAVALVILGLPPGSLVFETPEIPASHVLGVFAALCLASTRAPVRQRMVALVIGLVSMVVIELLSGVLAIHWALEDAAPVTGTVHRLRDHLTALPAWIGAPVIWLLLLGRWELPGPVPARSRASRPATRGEKRPSNAGSGATGS